MTKPTLKIAVAVCITGLAVALVIQSQSASKLREENQALRRQADLSAQLASENERLSNLVVQAVSAQKFAASQHEELLKLRNQVGLLHKQQREQPKALPVPAPAPASPPPNPTPATTVEIPKMEPIPKASWAFVGYATPESALQSVMWAMTQGDMAALQAGLTPEAQRGMATEYQGKTDAEIATLLAGEMAAINELRLDQKKINADGGVSFVISASESTGQTENGAVKVRDEQVLTFKNVDGQWKLMQ